MSTLIEEVVISDTAITVKFVRTIKISTLVDANFTLLEHAATPVASPFLSIDPTEHYHSISRTLTLYFHTALKALTSYQLTIANLKDASGSTITTESVTFTTDTDPSFSSDDLPAIPETEVVEVIDRSIKRTTVTSETIYTANPDFFIESTNPENNDYYLTTDYNNGRIIISFSTAPNSQFVNSTYLKVQRKVVQRRPARWESISVRYFLNSQESEVWIDFPSSDATPVYNTAGKEYFLQNYKYRVLISKNIGS